MIFDQPDSSSWKHNDGKYPVTYTEDPTKIPITLNKFGYRCKYPYPLNNDYAIAFGCSHTFGSALEEKYRYSNLVEKTLNIPVINLGIPGSSPGFVKDNLLQLFFYLRKNDIKNPNFIIVQWPSFARLWFGIHQNLTSDSFIKKEYLNNENLRKIENYNLMNYIHVNKLCHENDLMKIDFCMIKQHQFVALQPEETTEFEMKEIGDFIDLAKDGEHPGIVTHKLIHDYIIREL